MSKISFISSGDRKYIISRTLSLIKSDIISDIKDKKQIVVKPYCYYSSDQLSSTYADAIEATLDFIAPHVKSQIILAEGTVIGKTLDAFQNYDYFKLQEIYDFAVVDLNDDELIPVTLTDGNEIKVPATLANSDYIISVAPPRYDMRMTFAGAIVNLLEPIFQLNFSPAKKLVNKLGLRKRYTRPTQEFFSPNEIFELIHRLNLNLSVIDAYSIKKGVSSMHLNTPHWASSSTDFLANDTLACQLLGVPVDKVGYLLELANESDSNNNIVVGDDWRHHLIKL